MTTATTSLEPVEADITVGPLREELLPEADCVFRLAFGTALGLPDPARFAEGAELVRTRWVADPESAFAAELDGEVVGFAFVTRWGSYALMGPLAVRPDFWGCGVGHRLWEARLPLLDRWGVTHASLFTRAEPGNIHLYETFGFRARFLTALTAKELAPRADHEPGGSRLLTSLSGGARAEAVDACRAIADAIQPGLDLEPEIRRLADQAIGDTVLVGDDTIDGFAACHVGAGSEAGPGACYVRFAAVAPGTGAPRRFERLLDSVEAFAADHGASRLLLGVNTARVEAYGTLLERGQRPFAYGVAMHRPDEPAFDQPGAYVVQDGR
jgi:GNAT superfamily N-acetyltransferase